MEKREIAAQAFARLTERQCEVMLMAARGVPNKIIAIRLGIASRTVEQRIYFAYRKLGIRTRAQLAIMACMAGLLTDWEVA